MKCGDKVIGTCSLCGGAVMTYTTWMGVEPPPKTCASCGAHPKEQYGPTIEMERPKRLQEKLEENEIQKAIREKLIDATEFIVGGKRYPIVRNFEFNLTPKYK